MNDNVSPWGQTHEERIDELEAYVERLDAQIAALKAERDAAEDRVRVLEAQLSETHRKIANQRDANRRLTEDAHRRKAELAAMKSVAHTEARNWTLTANRLIAARQSRARLVKAVREQRELLKAARAEATTWKRAARKSFARYMVLCRPLSRRPSAWDMFDRAIAGTAQERRARQRTDEFVRQAVKESEVKP